MDLCNKTLTLRIASVHAIRPQVMGYLTCYTGEITRIAGQVQDGVRFKFFTSEEPLGLKAGDVVEASGVSFFTDMYDNSVHTLEDVRVHRIVA